MNFPTWTKPSLLGVAVGAIALAVLGFNWGGWVTGSTASEMSDSQSAAAVASALTLYCVANARNDPMSANKMSELDAVSSYQRRTFVEDSGWATPLGADEPNRDLADSCQDALNAET